MNNESPKSRRWLPFNSDHRELLSSVGMIVSAILIALFIVSFIIQSYAVDGESMETTLQNNDRLLVNKIPRSLARLTGHSYVPHRGDIIIFNQGGLSIGNGGDKQLIKRVIGLPGDRVVIKGGSITLYNTANPKGFDPDRSGLYTITAPSTAGDVDLTLSPGEIFVCGDNRGNSEDSRYFGAVQVNKVVGKLFVRILPLGKSQRF